MSAATWYYATAARRLGPFTAAQLRQLAAAGAVRPSAPVWDGDPGPPCRRRPSPARFWQTGLRRLVASGWASRTHPPPGVPAVRPSPVRRWVGEYAAVGAVGAGASLFSPDLASSGLVGGLAAGVIPRPVVSSPAAKT